MENEKVKLIAEANRLAIRYLKSGDAVPVFPSEQSLTALDEFDTVLPEGSADGQAILARAGWDVNEKGLFDAPQIPVVVSDECHVSVDKALRQAGFGRQSIADIDRAAVAIANEIKLA